MLIRNCFSLGCVVIGFAACNLSSTENNTSSIDENASQSKIVESSSSGNNAEIIELIANSSIKVSFNSEERGSSGNYVDSDERLSSKVHFSSEQNSSSSRYFSSAIRSSAIAMSSQIVSSEIEYSSSSKISYENFVDARDNKVYKIVTIASQIWMAENLRYDDSLSICPKGITDNCEKYGRLYSWYSMNPLRTPSNNVPSGVQGVCPTGWHIPSSLEWALLAKNLNLAKVSSSSYTGLGKVLKASEGWGEGKNGTNDYGFSAIPAGARISVFNYDDFTWDERDIGVGSSTYWWTSKERDSNEYDAIYYAIFSNLDGLSFDYRSKSSRFAVRCIKN